MSIIQQGTIISGHYFGWEILIDDDRNGNTGGYYIYLQNGASQGFDYWCKNEIDLRNQLTEFNVKWAQEK